MSEVTEMLGRLAEEAVKHSINEHDTGLARATAKLLLAMKSDGLVEDDDIRTHQRFMQNLLESGTLRPDAEIQTFFVGGPQPVHERGRKC